MKIRGKRMRKGGEDVQERGLEGFSREVSRFRKVQNSARKKDRGVRERRCVLVSWESCE